MFNSQSVLTREGSLEVGHFHPQPSTLFSIAGAAALLAKQVLHLGTPQWHPAHVWQNYLKAGAHKEKSSHQSSSSEEQTNPCGPKFQSQRQPKPAALNS